VGSYLERLWVGFEGDSGGEESADSLGERKGRFRKNLTRRNCNGGSQDSGLRLSTLLSLSRGCDSLSVGGGGFGGHVVGGLPVGVQMTGGPGGAGGVFPFGEFLRLPGVGVFLAKRLRVAIWCGRGSCHVVSLEIRVSCGGGPDLIGWLSGWSRRSSFFPFPWAGGVGVAGGGGARPTRGGCGLLWDTRAQGRERGLSG